MKKRKDECLFCKKRKCYERVVTKDDMGKSFDEVACPNHVNDLHRYSDERLPGVMKIFSSSTGRQVRGDLQIFKGID